MHFITAKSILSSQNGMNLYRGCLHGCIYCDSRSLCYQMNHLFEDIAVKENGLELLEATLKRKRRPCMIGTGSMSDPYLPLESELRYTRKALELIDRYSFGVTLITKSDRVLEDLDLLKRIQQRTKCVVQMTLTTYDDQLCRILEPNVCPTSERIKALKKLHENSIPTIVWLSPILPYINDTLENLSCILQACKEAGVLGIINFGMGVTMRDGNREYFYRQLDQFFPGLKDQYIRVYGLTYKLESPHSKELLPYFHDYCERYGIWHDNNQIFQYLREYPINEPEQLSLF